MWKSHFEHLMNEKTERDSIVLNMGVKIGRRRVSVQKGIGRNEVRKTINKF